VRKENFTLLKPKGHFYVLIALHFSATTSILKRFHRKNVTIAKSIFNDSIMLGVIPTAALNVNCRYIEINSIYLPPDFDYRSKKNTCFFSTVAGGKIFNEHHLLGELLPCHLSYGHFNVSLM
jgi:hypothetical protein